MNPVRNTKAITSEGKISNGVNPVRNTKAITSEGKISNGVNPVRPWIYTYVLRSNKTGRFYIGVAKTDMGNNILEIVLREV